MNKVKARGMGFGSAYNSYPAEVEFFVDEYAEDDEIRAKAIRKLKEKTACDKVAVTNIEVVRELSFSVSFRE